MLLGAAAYVNSFYQGYSGQFFWFCYIVLLLIGIGMLFSNSTLILMQINIMAIPLLIWSADFLYVLFTNNELFGVTNYFFIPGPVIAKVVTSQHLFTLPLSIFALYLIKIKRKDIWKFSFLELIILFLATRIFTLEEYNVNCVFRNCLNFNIGLETVYPIIWFAITFFMVISTNFIISRMKFLRK